MRKREDRGRLMRRLQVFEHVPRFIHEGAAKPPAHLLPIPIPERNFRTCWHFPLSIQICLNDIDIYPISPPDSRMQSPLPVPLETVHDMPVDDFELLLNLAHASRLPKVTTITTETKNRARPMSWDDKSGVLSQSLASMRLGRIMDVRQLSTTHLAKEPQLYILAQQWRHEQAR